MKERSGEITFQGQGLTLLGDLVRVEDTAPGFTALDTDLNPVSLSDYAGKVVVISSVPSLDTPVCDMQTRRFNQEAAALDGEVAVLTISMDLPFAQKRWCGAAGIEIVRTLSDHKDASFGLAYGLLIKELRLLARAVSVVGKNGKVSYVQLVKEVTEEPDYDAAVAAAKAAVEA